MLGHGADSATPIRDASPGVSAISDTLLLPPESGATFWWSLFKRKGSSPVSADLPAGAVVPPPGQTPPDTAGALHLELQKPEIFKIYICIFLFAVINCKHSRTVSKVKDALGPLSPLSRAVQVSKLSPTDRSSHRACFTCGYGSPRG